MTTASAPPTYAHGDATMTAYRQKEAAIIAAVRARYNGKSGHAWLTGPWDRTCVRCGLCVRSIVSNCVPIRRVEAPGVPDIVLLHGCNIDLPKCLDGDIGEYVTARSAAPWEHI